jgi:hypothetical protein
LRWTLSVDGPHGGPHARVDPHLTQEIEKNKTKNKLLMGAEGPSASYMVPQGLAVKTPLHHIYIGMGALDPSASYMELRVCCTCYKNLLQI